MKANDTLAKYNTKKNKLERLFILAINKYFDVAICPEFNDKDKFVRYVYMNKPINTETDEEDYETFDLYKLPENYISEIDNYINKDMFKTLMSMFIDGLAEDYKNQVTSKEITDIGDFIYENSARIFTKDQIHDFYDKVQIPTLDRVCLQEYLDMRKIRTISYGALETFKKEVLNNQIR